MMANAALLRPLARYVGGGGLSAWVPAQVLGLGVALHGVLRLLTRYAAHSGLASLQIGLTRCAGWQVPERYDFPLLARSPMDFWRRWNTYVRVWLEAYVFLPLATAVARRSRSRAAQAVVAFSVLVASGLLHDGYLFAGEHVASTRFTRLFLAAGLVALLWRLGGGVSTALRARLAGVPARRYDVTVFVTSHLLMASGLAAAALKLW